MRSGGQPTNASVACAVHRDRSVVRRTMVRSCFVILTMIAVALPLASMAAEPGRRTQVASTGAGGTARVRMVDNAFRPRRITITRGTRVRWTNRGEIVHTSTSTAGLWDSGLLVPGEAFTRRFNRVGTFRYFCTVHTTMRGRVIVTT